jgi:hypothetical protein
MGNEAISRGIERAGVILSDLDQVFRGRTCISPLF